MIDRLIKNWRFYSAAEKAALCAGFKGDEPGIESYGGNDSLLNAYYAGAVGGGHIDIVKRMLAQGADPSKGLDYAVTSEQVSMIRLMKQHGAKAFSPTVREPAREGNMKLLKHLLEGEHRSSDSNIYLTLALLDAARSGHLDIVKLLVEYGARKPPFYFECTPLDYAARRGHLEVVEYLLPFHSESDIHDAFQKALREGQSEVAKLLADKISNIDVSEALLNAARGGDIKNVKLFLEMGGNPNQPHALIEAVEGGNTEIVKLFLAHGVSADNRSAFVAAVKCRHWEIAKLLLKSGNFSVSSDCMTIACELGDAEVVQLMYEKGGDIIHDAPLHRAVIGKRTDIIKFLLEQGVFRELDIALKIAKESGYTEIASMLQEKQTILNKWNKLPEAARKGDFRGVKSMLQDGANPHTGMWEAAWAGHTEIVNLLLDKGANPNLGLEAAVWGNHNEIVKILLDKGAYPGLAIIAAICESNVEITKLLLDKGANPDMGVFAAARQPNAEIMQLLHDKGANVYDANVFRIAVIDGRIDIVQFLFKGGAHTNCENVIETAMEYGQMNVARWLIGNGFQINNKKFLLSRAAENGAEDLVRLMLLKGADPNEVEEEVEEVTGTIRYRTPLDWAIYYGHNACAEIIREAGGVRSTELQPPRYTEY